jgi:biopolymer transport protein ExbD
MGIQAGGKKGSVKSDINVTPLVDIVLVLLIIFLATTPVMMRQITVEVPRKLSDVEDPTIASKQITVLVRVDGMVVISDGRDLNKEVPRLELPATLSPIIKDKKTEKVVFVDFEDEVPYGEAVGAMDTIRGCGAEKVALKIREEGAESEAAPDTLPAGAPQ